MLSRYIRKESTRVVEKVMHLGLSKIWNINARKMSSWRDWINLPEEIKKITTNLEKIETKIQALKIKENPTPISELSKPKHQTAEDTVNKEKNYLLKVKEFFYKGTYDGIQGIIKIFAGVIFGGGIAYIIKDYLPEKYDNLLEKYLQGYKSKEKIYIKPVAFDSINRVARSGTQKLEDLINTKFSTGKKIFALTGPAGSGKSEMALEYANIMWSKFEKNSLTQTRIIQIIHAETPDILEKEYFEFAKRLNIDINDKKITKVQKEVNNILKIYSNWILIFDNVNEYEDIRNYIPEPINGKVLLTKQNPEGLFIHNIEIIDVMSIDYRLSDKEALELFKAKIPTLTSEQKSKIPTLAYKLLYSPLALKRTTDLIVNGKDFDNIFNIVNNFQQKQQKLSVNDKYRDNLLQLNKELIHSLPNDSKALLALILYSNPDYTHTILDMDSDLKKIGQSLSLSLDKVRDKIEIMSELKLKDIVSGYKGDRTHRSMREAFTEVIGKNEIEILKAIAPTYVSLKMSKYFKNDVLNNTPIIPHILTFYELVSEYKDKDKNLYFDAICALRNLGTQFVSSDPRQAKKYLENAKNAFEQFTNNHGSRNLNYKIDTKDFEDSQSLYIKLQEHNKILGRNGVNNGNLIDLYAGILYQLGRIYLHTKDINSKTPSVKYLQTAYELATDARQADLTIGQKNSIYDENKGFVFKQNGILFLELKDFEEKKLNFDQAIFDDYDQIILGQYNIIIDKQRKQLIDSFSKLDFRSLVTCYVAQARENLKSYELGSKSDLKDAKDLIDKILLIVEASNNEKQDLEAVNQLIKNELKSKYPSLVVPNKEYDLSLEFLAETRKNFESRLAEFYNLKGKIKLAENDFLEAKKYFDKTCRLLEKDGKFSDSFLAGAYLGKIKAEAESLEPLSLPSALENSQIIYEIEPLIDKSINIQKELGRSAQHPEMKEAQEWKSLADNLRIAERYMVIESEYTKQIVYAVKIQYDNPILNLDILDLAAQQGGVLAVNNLINIGKNQQEYQNFLYNRKTCSQEKAIPIAATDANNYKYISPDPSYPSYEVNQLTIASFTAKESIEASPTIKYFVQEILHLPFSLPKFIDNNYFRIITHYIVGNTGMISMTDKTDFLTPMLGTTIFGSKILIHETIERQNLLQFQATQDKLINTHIEFLEKCSFSIATQSMLGIVSSLISGTPVIYDLAINAAVGGMQCYNLYNQNAVINNSNSSIKIAITYGVDIFTLYSVAKNMQFDFSSQFGQMLVVKQGFVALSSVVIADYMTKLTLSSIEDSYLNSIMNNFNHNIRETFDNMYTYLIGKIEDTDFSS